MNFGVYENERTKFRKNLRIYSFLQPSLETKPKTDTADLEQFKPKFGFEKITKFTSNRLLVIEVCNQLC
jgi:hypothetical protein